MKKGVVPLKGALKNKGPPPKELGPLVGCCGTHTHALQDKIAPIQLCAQTHAWGRQHNPLLLFPASPQVITPGTFFTSPGCGIGKRGVDLVKSYDGTYERDQRSGKGGGEEQQCAPDIQPYATQSRTVHLCCDLPLPPPFHTLSSQPWCAPCTACAQGRTSMQTAT